MDEVHFDIVVSRVMAQKAPSPRRPGFDSRPVLVGYVVGTVAMEECLYRIAFDLLVFTNAPFSLIRTYVHTFIHSFTHSFIRPFIHHRQKANIRGLEL